MSAKLLPALITLVGVLAGIYVTFLHPPLVLTAGPGDYADARAHCEQVKKDYIQRESVIPSQDANGGFFEGKPNEFVDLFAADEYKRCISNSSVRISELMLQLFVITSSTVALVWATRFLK